MAGFDVAGLMPASLQQEGPTPAALQEMLDAIDKHSEQVRTSLFFNLMKSVASSPEPEVLEAMASLHSISSSSGAEQWVAQCANKYMEMQQHVAALQAELKAAQAAADLEATLREFRGFLENGQFSDAAYGLVQLRKILEDAGGQGAGAKQSAELAQLQAACSTCERDLEEALESSLAEAYDVSAEGCVITINCTLPSGGDVGQVWEAMELAGCADKHLAGVAGKLLAEVLPPTLAGAQQLVSHVVPSGDSAHVRWYGLQPGEAAAEPVEQQCMQLLGVLADALFRRRPTTLAAFGRAFWAGFVAQYEAAFLQQMAGSSVAALQARQEAARLMEQQAITMGLAEPASELAMCLTRAIQQSYHVAQQSYLAQARELLLAYDPHAPPVTVGQPLPLDAAFYERYRQGKVKAWEVLDPPCGWDVAGPVLATGYYCVSATLLQLVMAIDDALAYVCHQGDASMAAAIVGTVSKMAAMFGTMLPPPPAADAPGLALLRHNDLQYLANHLLLLPFLFGRELQELLGSALWFGDDALRLRNAARAAYSETLSVQVSAAMEAVVPLLQLSAAHAAGKPPPAKEAEATASAARQGALYLLRRAGRLLWGSLAPGVALEASQNLLDPLAGALVGDVLAKADIGEAEAGELVRLYRPLAEGAVPELLADVDLSAQALDAGVDLKELVSAALLARCRLLRKLGAVLGLLEARLADIVDAWEAGALKAAGLSLAEAGRLVAALFEDTDYRAQCLQRMAAAEGL